MRNHLQELPHQGVLNGGGVVSESQKSNLHLNTALKSQQQVAGGGHHHHHPNQQHQHQEQQMQHKQQNQINHHPQQMRAVSAAHQQSVPQQLNTFLLSSYGPPLFFKDNFGNPHSCNDIKQTGNSDQKHLVSLKEPHTNANSAQIDEQAVRFMGRLQIYQLTGLSRNQMIRQCRFRSTAAINSLNQMCSRSINSQDKYELLSNNREDSNRLLLTEDSIDRLSKACFKGYFISEGSRLYKMAEDRSTVDDQPNKSQHSAKASPAPGASINAMAPSRSLVLDSNQQQHNTTNNSQNNQINNSSFTPQANRVIESQLDFGFSYYEEVRLMTSEPNQPYFDGFMLYRIENHDNSGSDSQQKSQKQALTVQLEHQTTQLKLKNFINDSNCQFMICIPEDQSEYSNWQAAVESYIIQTRPLETIFDFSAKIGQGSFGSVYKAQIKPQYKIFGMNNNDKSCHQNAQCEQSTNNLKQQQEPTVAIKKLRKSQIQQGKNGIEYLLNEIKVHWALENCASVLKLLQLYEDEHNIYMVLEFQPKGTLMTVMEGPNALKQFSEAQARIIIEQILLALDFFSKKKIVHRDIKMENILISGVQDKSDFEIRVADFGLATFTPEDEPLTGKCGSPGFVAPEVFRGPCYSYKADVFSLGTVFYQILVGDYLFDGKTAKSIMKRNIDCELTHAYKFMKRMSVQCKDLLLQMLEADPEDRPTAKQCLQHQWFKQDKEVINELLQYNEIITSKRKLSSGGDDDGVNYIERMLDRQNSQNPDQQRERSSRSQQPSAGKEIVGNPFQGGDSGMFNSFMMGNNFNQVNNQNMNGSGMLVQQSSQVSIGNTKPVIKPSISGGVSNNAQLEDKPNPLKLILGLLAEGANQAQPQPGGGLLGLQRKGTQFGSQLAVPGMPTKQRSNSYKQQKKKLFSPVQQEDEQKSSNDIKISNSNRNEGSNDHQNSHRSQLSNRAVNYFHAIREARSSSRNVNNQMNSQFQGADSSPQQTFTNQQQNGIQQNIGKGIPHQLNRLESIKKSQQPNINAEIETSQNKMNVKDSSLNIDKKLLMMGNADQFLGKQNNNINQQQKLEGAKDDIKKEDEKHEHLIGNNMSDFQQKIQQNQDNKQKATYFKQNQNQNDQVPIMLIAALEDDNENSRQEQNQHQMKPLASQLTPGIIQRLNRFGLIVPPILIEEMSQSPGGMINRSNKSGAMSHQNKSKTSNKQVIQQHAPEIQKQGIIQKQDSIISAVSPPPSERILRLGSHYQETNIQIASMTKGQILPQMSMSNKNVVQKTRRFL